MRKAVTFLIKCELSQSEWAVSIKCSCKMLILWFTIYSKLSLLIWIELNWIEPKNLIPDHGRLLRCVLTLFKPCVFTFMMVFLDEVACLVCIASCLSILDCWCCEMLFLRQENYSAITFVVFSGLPGPLIFLGPPVIAFFFLSLFFASFLVDLFCPFQPNNSLLHLHWDLLGLDIGGSSQTGAKCQFSSVNSCSNTCNFLMVYTIFLLILLN